VLDLLAKAGTDIATTAGTTVQHGTLEVSARGVTHIIRLRGKAEISAFKFSIPAAQAMAFEHVRLRVTWDGRKKPSIDAPISLFYGAGTLFNRANREYLVKALPVNIRFTGGRVELACYFPMPYFHSARIDLVGAGAAVPDVQWSLRTMPLDEPANFLSYFHATYQDIPHPTPGEDMTLLDTRGVDMRGIEGARDW
jgi:hypothetical protein